MRREVILCDNSNVEETAKIAKKYGYGIEVQSFHKPALCEDKEQIDFHKKCIKGILPVSLHAPFADLCPGSSDPMLREVAKNRFELGYKAATKLNATHMVFHIGRVPGAGVPERWADRCIQFWKEFLIGKSEEIYFHIENQFDHTPEVLSLIIDGINNDKVSVCLDIGHAHCHSKLSVVQRIKVLKDKIGYVHIHDNNGEEDQHLGIGKGNINMMEVFSALDTYAPNAIFTMECEDMEESIERLQKNKFL